MELNNIFKTGSNFTVYAQLYVHLSWVPTQEHFWTVWPSIKEQNMINSSDSLGTFHFRFRSKFVTYLFNLPSLISNVYNIQIVLELNNKHLPYLAIYSFYYLKLSKAKPKWIGHVEPPLTPALLLLSVRGCKDVSESQNVGTAEKKCTSWWIPPSILHSP